MKHSEDIDEIVEQTVVRLAEVISALSAELRMLKPSLSDDESYSAVSRLALGSVVSLMIDAGASEAHVLHVVYANIEEMTGKRDQDTSPKDDFCEPATATHRCKSLNRA